MRLSNWRMVMSTVAMLTGLVTIACGGESAGGRFKRYTVNGVAMIENPARIGAPATFRLADSVTRDIGGLKEREEDEFNHRNGFLTGVVLASGGLAVIDWTKVRLFDSAGEATAVVGREGRGPGEFVGLTQICRLPGDTVLVYDQNRRLTMISPTGAIVRQSNAPDVSLLGDGCFDDGTIVTQAFERTTNAIVRETHAIRRRDDGTIVDTIGVFPALSFSGVGQYMRLHPHGRFLYVSDPRKNEVRRFRQDGTLDQVVRMADKARSIDADAGQRWLGGAVAAAGSSDASPSVRETGELTWPFYRGLKIDGTGRLWVRDFPAGDDAPDRWTVYDSSGVFVGSLDVPRGPRRAIPNPPPGAPATMQGAVPEFVDAFGDFIILLERDADGAAHFRTRRIR
jgi:hypothetical protein